MAERTKPLGIAGEMAAEFAGTAILILFGVGSVAQVVAGGIGDHNSIAWGWGLGVTFGIYTAGRLTGAHLNPAVTVAFALFRGFSWAKVAPFALAQTAGAFVAALIVRWSYNDVITAVDPELSVKTQGIFSTLPGNGELPVGIGSAFLDQVVGTAILLFLIFAVVDVRNTSPLSNLAPVVIGFIVLAIGFTWATNAGYAINPARDLGPRLASYVTGYGTAWRDQNGGLYFWVPIIGPLVGAVLGAFLYDRLIGVSLPVADEEIEPGRVPSESASDASSDTA